MYLLYFRIQMMKICCGRNNRLLTDQGVPVTYACGTLGQMGRNMGKNVFANRETIPHIRKKELKDACEAMGIKDLRMLGFHDKTLEFEDVDFVADKIEAIIQEVNPSRIITFYPEHVYIQIIMHLPRCRSRCITYAKRRAPSYSCCCDYEKS